MSIMHQVNFYPHGLGQISEALTQERAQALVAEMQSSQNIAARIQRKGQTYQVILTSTRANPILETAATTAIAGMAFHVGMSAMRSFLPNPAINSSQQAAVLRITGGRKTGLKVGRLARPHPGCIYVQFNGHIYILDEQGQVVPFGTQTNPLPSTEASCPACGALNTFKPWDVYVRCSQCNARLRHVVIRRK